MARDFAFRRDLATSHAGMTKKLLCIMYLFHVFESRSEITRLDEDRTKEAGQWKRKSDVVTTRGIDTPASAVM